MCQKQIFGHLPPRNSHHHSPSEVLPTRTPKTMQPDSPFASTPPPTCNPNPNPNPYQPLQALHFLRLLAKINGSGSNSTTTETPAAISIRRRSICIRRAAYASMAYAVGPRRAWSRALLRRLRRGGRTHPAPVARRIKRAGRVTVVTTGGSKPVWENTRADELRKLVPGGRGMDIFSLLDETRNYIQCLSSQVSVLQSVVDAFPSNN